MSGKKMREITSMRLDLVGNLFSHFLHQFLLFCSPPPPPVWLRWSRDERCLSFGAGGGARWRIAARWRMAALVGWRQ